MQSVVQEIIEFSCAILDAQSLQIVAEFQRYCRPTEHPVLTAFCTELTGISQATCAFIILSLSPLLLRHALTSASSVRGMAAGQQ